MVLIDNPQTIKKFLLGGKAQFVLLNTNSNNSIQFKLTLKNIKDDSKLYYLFHNKLYCGYLKVEVYNNENISYFGVPCNKKNLTDIDVHKYFLIFNSYLSFIFKDTLPKGTDFYHIGKCSICGRALSDPTSIKIGIGKICLEKYT